MKCLTKPYKPMRSIYRIPTSHINHISAELVEYIRSRKHNGCSYGDLVYKEISLYCDMTEEQARQTYTVSDKCNRIRPHLKRILKMGIVKRIKCSYGKKGNLLKSPKMYYYHEDYQPQ